MKQEIKLAQAEACVGCAACADICPKGCIHMTPNGEGFLYPDISDRECVACGQCMSVCPVLQDTQRNEIQKLYAAWMNDTQRIQGSTSGGVFQSLAQRVLDQGGVVFGAAFHDGFTLVHTQCESVQELPALLGSKYLQSNTQGVYKAVDHIAKTGKTVLFSGTPCQCDALKRYYLVRNKGVPDNVLLCEIMCHGVPSPGVFQDYISYLETKKHSKIVSYDFRYKKLRGWKVLSQCIEYSNRRKDAHRAKYDAWHVWFGAHLSVRTSCYDCRYRATGRVADMTLGDFWSILKVKPDLDTQNGVSAVFVNTEKGHRYFNDCTGLLSTIEIDVKRVEELFNVPIRKGTVTMPREREEFFALYKQGGIKALMKKYPPQNLFTAVIAKLKWMIQK